MRPIKLLIFGSPKAGTPLMVAAPGIAIDLPLKILVWEDAQAKVWGQLQPPGVFAGAAQPAVRLAAKHHRSRNVGDEGGGIVAKS